MAKKNENHANPNDDAIRSVVCPLQQLQIADAQGQLEETDAQLVPRPTGKVDSGVNNEVFVGPREEREA